MERNRLAAIRRADQLDGSEEPFGMVEMAVREHQGLDPPEIEAHVPAIALEGIGIRARIEEHGAGFAVPIRRDRQAQPMVGRAERLACELRHPRVHEDAQLGGDVLGTAREHIRCVIHNDVDGQPVYGLHDPPPGRQERHLDGPGATTPASDGHDLKTYLNRPDDANQGTSGPGHARVVAYFRAPADRPGLP